MSHRLSLIDLINEVQLRHGFFVKPRTVRFYVTKGLVNPPRRQGVSGGGIAGLYKAECVERLWAIDALARQRFSLNEIREFFRQCDRRKIPVKTATDRVLKRLMAEARRIQGFRKIDELLEQLRDREFRKVSHADLKLVVSEASVESSADVDWERICALLGKLVDSKEAARRKAAR